MNKTELLNRCARDGEERILLARVLDKLELSQNRGVPAHTAFLSPGEQAAVTALLSAWGRAASSSSVIGWFFSSPSTWKAPVTQKIFSGGMPESTAWQIVRFI